MLKEENNLFNYVQGIFPTILNLLLKCQIKNWGKYTLLRETCVTFINLALGFTGSC